MAVELTKEEVEAYLSRQDMRTPLECALNEAVSNQTEKPLSFLYGHFAAKKKAAGRKRKRGRPTREAAAAKKAAEDAQAAADKAARKAKAAREAQAAAEAAAASVDGADW